MKKLVLYGNTDFARLIKYYIEEDAKRKVDCVVVDREYIQKRTFEGIKVVPFDIFVETHSTKEYEILICIGYSQMNMVRQRIFKKCKGYGYKVASFIHSSVKIPQNVVMGEGNIIFEGVTIQAFSKIGNSNLIWYNASVAHDCIVGDFNTIAGSSSLSGFVNIKNNCFIGNNATIRDHINIGAFTLIGAGTYIDHDTEDYSVFVPEKAKQLDYRSVDMNL